VSTAELDAQVLGHVTSRPGSSVWDLCLLFPQVPARAPAGDGLMGPPLLPRLVPSVTPAQVCASLARLRRGARVRVTRDPGWPGTERWHPLDY
jgi:hypothetical protein